MYRAEATVNAMYNLHIEREGSGRFFLYQRCPDAGEYVSCQGVPENIVRGPRVIDYSFDHGVYPMHIRIESETAVTSGTITEAQ